MRKLLIASLLLIPTAAVASLNYTDTDVQYNDAKTFTQSERVAINVLTHLGAVEGNPDGTFLPRRTLNRAEFLKIALLSVNPAFDSGADWCFPDVRSEDWFSRYVCYAKNEGIVKGYPDGLFHPEREVNYVEALKILVEAHNLGGEHRDGEEWYVAYLRAAEQNEVQLSEAPRFTAFLTRGQMARLAAAFSAKAEGELEEYRAAERGETLSSSSSSASSVSSESSSSVSSDSSASSVSSSSAASSVIGFSLPATERLTLVDRISPPVADGTFTVTQEMLIREARITLVKRIKSFSDMYLTDASGNILGTMRLDQTDTTYEKWYVSFEAAAAPHIAANQPTVFAITGKMRPWGYGGVSGEMIQVERMAFIVQKTDLTESSELLPTTTHFPRVQTTQTMLTKIANAGENAGTLTAGTNKVIGSFTFSGSLLPGTSVLELQYLQFKVAAVGADIVSPRIGLTGTTAPNTCSYSNGLVTCSLLPNDARDASDGITLDLRADVTRTGEGVHTLQVSLDDNGAFDRPGAVQWFDGSTPFSWVDTTKPLATGTAWTVVNP